MSLQIQFEQIQYDSVITPNMNIAGHKVFGLTLNGNCIINAEPGGAGATAEFLITDPVGDRLVVFGTNFTAIGPMQTFQNIQQSYFFFWDTGTARWIQASFRPHRFGNAIGANHLDFEKNGFLIAYGDAGAYEDRTMPSTRTRQGNTQKPDFDETNVGLLFPQNDPAEILFMDDQLPHTWEEGTTIYPHVHWTQAQNLNVTWKLAYKWTNPNQAPAGAFTTVTLDTLFFTYTAGNLHQISYLPGGISGAGKTISSILKMKLYRQDNVYVGDALEDSFDYHMKLNSLGSRSQWTKA